MPTRFEPVMYAIDFGTSNSLLAAANARETHAPIPLDLRAADPSVLRSILFHTDGAHWSFGKGALADYVERSMHGRFIRSVKRFLPMASFSETRVGSRKLSLEELVGIFLEHMRQSANAFFGADVRRVLLGRPARFSDDDASDALAERRLRAAAEFAGFEDIRFCPEPLAAAYDMGSELEQERVVLIADLGGGTSDYTVARIAARAATLDVLALGGIAVAGDALDGALVRRRIARHFGSEVRYKVPFGSNWLAMPTPLLDRLCSPAELCLLARGDVLEFLRGVRSGSEDSEDKGLVDQLMCLIEDGLGFQLFEAVERTKLELSSAAVADFRFEYPGIDITERVTRSEFEALIAPFTTAILERLDQTLARAGLAHADIELVCSTGGTARVPLIAAGLRERFGASKLRELKSFHSVIQGLAERARGILAAEA